MNKLQFNNFEELSCKISDDFEEIQDEFKDVSIIAKYDEAREVIKQLVCLGCSVRSIIFEDPEANGYEDEFIIALADIEESDDKEIWCEPFKRNGQYLSDGAVITYVFGNCNSKCLENIQCKEIYEVSIVNDRNRDNSCNDFFCDDDLSSTNSESVTLSKSKDGVVHGFTKTWSNHDGHDNQYYASYSLYSSNEDTVKKIARSFGVEI